MTDGSSRQQTRVEPEYSARYGRQRDRLQYAPCAGQCQNSAGATVVGVVESGGVGVVTQTVAHRQEKVPRDANAGICACGGTFGELANPRMVAVNETGGAEVGARIVGRSLRQIDDLPFRSRVTEVTIYNVPIRPRAMTNDRSKYVRQQGVSFLERML